MTTTLHPAARLRRSGDGNIALGKMAHAICDEHERIVRDLGAQNADMWLEALCGLLGGMVEPVRRDDADDDLPTSGCPTCDAVLDTLPSYIGRSGGVALAVQCAVDAIGRAERERDEARAEVERLRAEAVSLRQRPTTPPRDRSRDYARMPDPPAEAPNTDEPDDGWAPGPWWTHYTNGGASAVADGLPGAQVHRAWPSGWVGVVWTDPRQQGRRSDAFGNARAAMRWCEAQPEMADVIAAHNSAPVVGATDAGPDAPALIVEGDAAKDALPESAVPAAPVSTAEQRDGETGVDRPPQPDTVVLNEDDEVVARVSDSDGYRCVGCDEAPFPSRDKWCECFDHGILRAFDAREHDASPTTIDGAVVADMSVSDDLRGPDTEEGR